MYGETLYDNKKRELTDLSHEMCVAYLALACLRLQKQPISRNFNDSHTGERVRLCQCDNDMWGREQNCKKVCRNFVSLKTTEKNALCVYLFGWTLNCNYTASQQHVANWFHFSFYSVLFLISFCELGQRMGQKSIWWSAAGAKNGLSYDGVRSTSIIIVVNKSRSVVVCTHISFEMHTECINSNESMHWIYYRHADKFFHELCERARCIGNIKLCDCRKKSARWEPKKNKIEFEYESSFLCCYLYLLFDSLLCWRIWAVHRCGWAVWNRLKESN